MFGRRLGGVQNRRLISARFIWSSAPLFLFSVPLQRPPPLPLIGPEGGLADVAFQNLGWFLGAFGLQSNPESQIPLGAACLSARDLELLLPSASTATFYEKLQDCPFVSIFLFPRVLFLLLLSSHISMFPVNFPPFLRHFILFRVFRCGGGVESGARAWRLPPLHSLVHQRCQEGERGCCGASRIVLLKWSWWGTLQIADCRCREKISKIKSLNRIELLYPAKQGRFLLA